MADDNKIIAELELRGKDAFVKSLKDGQVGAEKLSASVKEAGDTGAVAMDKLATETKAATEEVKKSEKATVSYKAQLKAMQAEIIDLTIGLQKMKAAGKEGTAEFNELQQKIKQLTDDAGELKDVIGDVSDTVKNAGSDTRGIDNALRGINAMASGFQVVEGASALFGVESEKLQETLVRLNAVMAISNGLQQLQDEALKNDSVFTLAATKAKSAYNLVVGQGTGAMKLFRLALASTGIGLLVIALGLLVAKFDDVKKYLTSIFPQLNGLGERFNKVKEDIKLFLKDGVLNVLNGFIRIYNSSALVRGAFSAIGQAVISVKDILVNNFKIIGTVFGSLFEAIQQRSFAPIKQGFKDIAALALDTGKKVIENIKSITTEGNLSLLTANDIVSDAEAKKTGEKVAKAVKQEMEISPIALKVDIRAQDVFKALEDQAKLVRDRITELFSQDILAGIEPSGDRQIQILIDELKRLETEIAARKAEFDELINGSRATAKQVMKAEGGVKNETTFFERMFGTREENEAQAERTTEIAQGAQVIIEQLSGFSEKIGSIASQAISIKAENELRDLQAKKDRGLITEKEYEKKSAAIKNEAARKQRAVDIANATAQIPIAVLQAFIAGMQIGGPIAAGILAGVAGAFAVAQVALIAAAPLPQFRKGGSVAKRLGLIKGASHEQGGVPIEVEGDEFVMNKKAVAKYGVGFMEKINDMKFNPVIAADKKISAKTDREYKLNENLATIGMYLKQGYKLDSRGNRILEQIRDNIGTTKTYV